MRVRTNLDSHAQLLGLTAIAPIEVQPMRISVEFYSHADLCCFLKYGFDVYRVWLAGQQQSPRRMRQNGEVRIIHRRENAVGHRVAFHAEARVDRTDDVIELVENVCIVVEASISENVG